MTWGTTSCGPINMFTWSSLYPYNYATNYGGQFQYNVMPSYLTPGQALGIQNIFNPFYQFAQLTGSFNSAFNPFQNMQQIMLNQTAYANGYNMGLGLGNQVSAQTLCGNIASLKGQLEQAKESEQLSKEQKAVLEDLLKQAVQLENKLKDLEVLQQNGANTQQVGTAIAELNKEYRELHDKVQKSAEKIKSEIEKVKENESSDEDTQEIITENNDDNAIPQSMADRQQVRAICDVFADSIDGIGTSNKEFKAALEAVTADNVVEVMQHWNKTYKNEFNESFMESFMWDANHRQKRDYGKHILEQLQARADISGVDIDVEAVKIRRELNSWFINNNISADFDAILDKIAKAEA